MSAEVVATTRLIMHLAGMFGAAADAGWPRQARMLLNNKHIRERPTGNGAGGGVLDIFFQGAQRDIDTLRRLSGRTNDLLALGVHMVLESLMDAAEGRENQRYSR